MDTQDPPLKPPLAIDYGWEQLGGSSKSKSTRREDQGIVGDQLLQKKEDGPVCQRKAKLTS